MERGDPVAVTKKYIPLELRGGGDRLKHFRLFMLKVNKEEKALSEGISPLTLEYQWVYNSARLLTKRIKVWQTVKPFFSFLFLILVFSQSYSQKVNNCQKVHAGSEKWPLLKK